MLLSNRTVGGSHHRLCDAANILEEEEINKTPSCHSLNDLQVVWETCVAHVGSKIDHTHVKK